MVGAGLVSASHIAGDSWLSLVGGRDIVRHGLPSQDAVVARARTRLDQVEERLGSPGLARRTRSEAAGVVMVVGRIAVTIE